MLTSQRKPITLYHCSPKDRRDNIVRNGLQSGHKRTGRPYKRYSSSKVSPVLFLSNSANVDAMDLLTNHGSQWDVWLIEIPPTDEKVIKGLQSLPGKTHTPIDRCLRTTGECAFVGSIPFKYCTLLYTIDGESSVGVKPTSTTSDNQVKEYFDDLLNPTHRNG